MYFPRKFLTSIKTLIITFNQNLLVPDFKQHIWVFIALCYFHDWFTEAVARLWSVKHLKNIAKFTRNMYWSLFFNKITGRRQTTLFKKWSDTGVFPWILWNFSVHLFYRNPLNGCFLVKMHGKCDNLFYTLQNWNPDCLLLSNTLCYDRWYNIGKGDAMVVGLTSRIWRFTYNTGRGDALAVGLTSRIWRFTAQTQLLISPCGSLVITCTVIKKTN